MRSLQMNDCCCLCQHASVGPRVYVGGVYVMLQLALVHRWDCTSEHWASASTTKTCLRSHVPPGPPSPVGPEARRLPAAAGSGRAMGGSGMGCGLVPTAESLRVRPMPTCRPGLPSRFITYTHAYTPGVLCNFRILHIELPWWPCL